MLPNLSNHTPCLNLSRFRALIFNSFTNQRELAEPLLFPYLSCTYKATTPPRRALIYLQLIKLPQTTQKPQKRRAQCHHFYTRTFSFVICLSISNVWFLGNLVSINGKEKLNHKDTNIYLINLSKTNVVLGQMTLQTWVIYYLQELRNIIFLILINNSSIFYFIKFSLNLT